MSGSKPEDPCGPWFRGQRKALLFAVARAFLVGFRWARRTRLLLVEVPKSLNRRSMLRTPLHLVFLGLFQTQNYVRNGVETLDELDRTIRVADVSW